MTHQLHVAFAGIVFLLLAKTDPSTASSYYAITTFESESTPLHGSVYAYNPQSSAFRFYGNFSFKIDDNDTELYYFEAGPVAVAQNASPVIYMPVQCGTSFQRLLLLSYNMQKKTYQQSRWLLHDGVFHFLHYDPRRQRLFGLRDVDTFTLIIEEYNITTLDVVKEYTRQDGEQYAFPYAWCSAFDYDENWLVQVRTRFEGGAINAYYIKMDLNLVGKKPNIVTEFYLLPDVHNLCTMTYDMQTKLVLATWQHGSIDQDLVMLYMDPYTSKFRNETLLLETGSGYVIESVKTVFNLQSRQILFMIGKQDEEGNDGENWMVLVEFDTMKIMEKKPVETIPDFDSWEFFLF